MHTLNLSAHGKKSDETCEPIWKANASQSSWVIDVWSDWSQSQTDIFPNKDNSDFFAFLIKFFYLNLGKFQQLRWIPIWFIYERDILRTLRCSMPHYTMQVLVHIQQCLFCIGWSFYSFTSLCTKSNDYIETVIGVKLGY